MPYRPAVSEALARFRGDGAPSDTDVELPGSWLTFRGMWANVLFLWRTSLPFRTIALSVALASVTVLSVGLVMSNSIANDLFTSRVAQVLSESDRAASQAQQTFNSGVETDLVALTTLREQALDIATAATPNSTGYAFYRTDAGDDRIVLQDIASESVDVSLITPELRQAVANGDGVQQYQSVELALSDGSTAPGLIVGSEIEVPSAGPYELYFVYSLEESQRTLDFVQRTLLGAMLVLVLLIAVIVGLVMRSVVQRIRTAAQVSRKLAGGQLDERIPETGEDDIATLARSFNDMADSLHEQINRLATLSQVQQRFVSDVSHELRTPLTTIRLAGGVLYDKRDDFDPLTGRSVELLHDQIQRFDLLLSDLLEISRYDAGAVELLRAPNNLVAVAEDVIDSLTQIALDHGTKLVLRAPGGYGESEFDARRVTRVVRNLVGNAIEHGERKPIVVSVDSNETAVAISVRDYGVGMTSEQRARVFDRFWRADPSRKRTMGGTGLGLAISMEDAVLHEGQIDVWSEPGKGASFRLTLPRTVGVPIEYSPLPLEPEDAGAETLADDAVEDALVEPFTDEDVDTQPIVLPDLVAGSGEETAAGEPVVSTAAISVVDIAEAQAQAEAAAHAAADRTGSHRAERPGAEDGRARSADGPAAASPVEPDEPEDRPAADDPAPGSLQAAADRAIAAHRARLAAEAGPASAGASAAEPSADEPSASKEDVR
ncbi:Sensor histidine kinase MtrB [Pseudoclavibacter triregionum]|nr:Sensor histidine kinase MtrB [Pseudoclavibacter triregionum]